MTTVSEFAKDENGRLQKADEMSPEYMLALLSGYYEEKWNVNESVLKTLAKWRDWPVVVRVPDLGADFTVMIDEGRVVSIEHGKPAQARILVVMAAGTQEKIYFEETTAAIEAIAGRIKIRGNETERRRMLAAISYLTW
ncbi:MAG: hypothetical protein JSU06_13490 [Actinobacteria bacterium]|nr:hypothetical protein [Actinomycetota bacterium]